MRMWERIHLRTRGMPDSGARSWHHGRGTGNKTHAGHDMHMHTTRPTTRPPTTPTVTSSSPCTCRQGITRAHASLQPQDLLDMPTATHHLYRLRRRRLAPCPRTGSSASSPMVLIFDASNAGAAAHRLTCESGRHEVAPESSVPAPGAGSSSCQRTGAVGVHGFRRNLAKRSSTEGLAARGSAVTRSTVARSATAGSTAT